MQVFYASAMRMVYKKKEMQRKKQSFPSKKMFCVKVNKDFYFVKDFDIFTQKQQEPHFEIPAVYLFRTSVLSLFFILEHTQVGLIPRRGNLATFKRCKHGTTRFMGMGAVAIFTIL